MNASTKRIARFGLLTALALVLVFAGGRELGRLPNPALKAVKSSFQLLQVHCIFDT